MVSGLCGDTTIGVVQLKRRASAGGPPGASGGGGASGVVREGRTKGRIALSSPLTVSNRITRPSCISTYAVVGSFGGAVTYMPSPPPTWIQSSLRGPTRLRVALGPDQTPLSWSPPYTKYGSR